MKNLFVVLTLVATCLTTAAVADEAKPVDACAGVAVPNGYACSNSQILQICGSDTQGNMVYFGNQCIPVASVPACVAYNGQYVGNQYGQPSCGQGQNGYGNGYGYYNNPYNPYGYGNGGGYYPYNPYAYGYGY